MATAHNVCQVSNLEYPEQVPVGNAITKLELRVRFVRERRKHSISVLISRGASTYWVEAPLLEY